MEASINAKHLSDSFTHMLCKVIILKTAVDSSTCQCYILVLLFLLSDCILTWESKEMVLPENQGPEVLFHTNPEQFPKIFSIPSMANAKGTDRVFWG